MLFKIFLKKKAWLRKNTIKGSCPSVSVLCSRLSNDPPRCPCPSPWNPWLLIYMTNKTLQMWLRILRWGDCSGLSGWVLREQACQHQRKCDNRSRGWSDVRPQANECGQPLEARKARETDSPWEPPDRMQVYRPILGLCSPELWDNTVVLF